jgi:xanthosine utilization system XapX-like protein
VGLDGKRRIPASPEACLVGFIGVYGGEMVNKLVTTFTLMLFLLLFFAFLSLFAGAMVMTP